MSSHTTLIAFIVTLLITAAGVVVVWETVSAHAGAVVAVHTDVLDATGQFTLTNLIADNITGGGVKYIRIQVRYDGTTRLPLNDTYVELRTDKGFANLVWRNGTLSRDQSGGFYTIG